MAMAYPCPVPEHLLQHAYTSFGFEIPQLCAFFPFLAARFLCSPLHGISFNIHWLNDEWSCCRSQRETVCLGQLLNATG